MIVHSISCAEAIPNDGAVFLALGNFDGVHAGHAALLSAACEGARELGAGPAVFTFRTSKAPALTTEEERMALFARAGIQTVFAAEFEGLRSLSPEDFIRRVLVGMGAVGVVCGFNFRFGKGAAGDADLLCRLCRQEGILCRILDAVMLEGITVSSTEIRRRLSEGDLEGVARLLGRPWSIGATVVHGRAVGGRLLSSPTLNLPIDRARKLPPFGVYFTRAQVEGISYPAITNLGVRPTFGESEILAETHLLGVSGDFYGKQVTVEFLAFRRPERKFDSPEALADAIVQDIAAARAYFGQ